MRRNVFTKAVPNVVSALVVFFVSNGSFAQAQRSPTEPEQRDVGWAMPTDRPPHLSEPSRRTSGSGSGFDGTTPILHESAKLTASDADYYAGFGRSTSVSGNAAVVGTWSDLCSLGSICGAAYVFRFNGTRLG